MAVFAGVFAIPLVTRRFEKWPGSNPTLSAIFSISYRQRNHSEVVDLPGQAAKKPAMVASERVIQYGPDVSVWPGDPTKRNGLDRLRHAGAVLNF